MSRGSKGWEQAGTRCWLEELRQRYRQEQRSLSPLQTEENKQNIGIHRVEFEEGSSNWALHSVVRQMEISILIFGLGFLENTLRICVGKELWASLFVFSTAQPCGASQPPTLPPLPESGEPATHLI